MSQVNVQIGADTSGFQRAVNGLDKTVQGFGSRMKGALGGIGVAMVGKKIFDDVIQIDRLTRAYTVMEGSVDLAKDRMEEFKETAKLPGVQWEQALQANLAFRAVGLSADESKAAIIEFGNALSLAGRGPESMEHLQLALTQIGSKAQVSAEEINQIAEHVPQVRAVMKDVFGSGDTRDIQAMGIPAKEFITSLTKGFQSLDRASAGLDEQISDIATSAKIAASAFGQGFFTEAIGGMQSFTQSIDANIESIKHLGEYMRELAVLSSKTVKGVAGFGTALGEAIGAGAVWLQNEIGIKARMEGIGGMTREEAIADIEREDRRRAKEERAQDPFGMRNAGPFIPEGFDPFSASEQARQEKEKKRPNGYRWRPSTGSPIMNAASLMAAEVGKIMGPFAEAMRNVLMEQSEAFKTKASELSDAAFSPLRGDIDTSYGRGKSVNPLTDNATKQISEMMRQSSILEKQAAKLDINNQTLKAIEAAIKSQKIGYN